MTHQNLLGSFEITTIRVERKRTVVSLHVTPPQGKGAQFTDTLFAHSVFTKAHQGLGEITDALPEEDQLTLFLNIGVEAATKDHNAVVKRLVRSYLLALDDILASLDVLDQVAMRIADINPMAVNASDL